MTLLAIPARLAISAMVALAYPDSAMTSAVHWMIWARRASSMNVRSGPSFLGCMPVRYCRPHGRKFGHTAYGGGADGRGGHRADAGQLRPPAVVDDRPQGGSRLRVPAARLGHRDLGRAPAARPDAEPARP